MKKPKLTKEQKLKEKFEFYNRKFIDQGRTDIQLCEDEFVGWKHKSKFFDLIEKDYFWSIPYKVYVEKIVHPNRRSEKKKQTNLEKFATEAPAQSKIILEKIKKTNLERYGSEFGLQNKEVIEKRKQTNIERYGVISTLQTEPVKEKSKKSMIEKHGVVYPAQSTIIKNKIKQTNLEKYGFENPGQSNEIQCKIKKTNLAKYGTEFQISSSETRKKIKISLLEKYNVDHFSQVHAVKIDGINETLKQWLENQPEPKPSYVTMIRCFNKHKTVTIENLELFIKNYKENKTQLEVLAENLFNVKHYNCSVNNTNMKYRPDFKLSDSVYVNVDGLYWHSEKEKNNYSHYNLRKEFEENNLRIFQFHENEIKNKPEIVISIVNNSLIKNTKNIGARQCEIKIVEQKKGNDFLNKNHLMGQIKAKHVGLYFNNNLVTILSYKEKKNICKIERFCSLIDHNINGGFSKLLNYLENNLLKSTTKEIHNWVDLRYGTGKHLETKGFKLIRETLGWKWTDYIDTYNRLYCRANMDERKISEKEHAKELGLVKIYDAGQRLYVKLL